VRSAAALSGEPGNMTWFEYRAVTSLTSLHSAGSGGVFAGQGAGDLARRAACAPADAELAAALANPAGWSSRAPRWVLGITDDQLSGVPPLVKLLPLLLEVTVGRIYSPTTPSLVKSTVGNGV
jgi:hypothetical protein